MEKMTFNDKLIENAINKGEIVQLIDGSLTLIAGTAITDYKIVVQNISSKQPFCKLTITKKVL